MNTQVNDTKVEAVVEKLQNVFLTEVLGPDRTTQLLTEKEQERVVERFSDWVEENAFVV